MYLGSDEFNNAIENTSGNAPKIRVTLEDGTTLDNIKSIKYYGGSNDSDDVSIGTTNMARIDVTAFTDKMLTNNEIFLEQGIELADGVVEYMPIGYFTIQKPSGDIDEVSFTAYDRMQKFEKPYSSSLAYPTTSALILDELCQICGIELATTLGNAIEVTENLKGYTCREVLGYIASMHGYFACIDRYGRLNVRWYSDTPIEKSLKKIWHFEKSQDNFEIAKVEIVKDSETKYESGNGITTLHNSNPLATQEIVDNVFAKLGGFSYSVGEIEMLDDARLDPWDMVSIEYYDGKTYNIPCMTLEHDFKAYSTTVKSVGKSESENEYRFTGPTIQYLNRMAADLLVANRVIATKVDAEYVNSVAITTENFDAKVAEIKELIVEEIDGKYADIDLANIDIANINVGKIGELFAKVGLIDRATIVEGHITGFLDAVEINANKITAGTLIADRLLLRGSEQSILYQLNSLSRNLIPYPYVTTNKTLNGITWTVNEDGTITVNGTATAVSYFFLDATSLLSAGTYTISGCPSGGGSGKYFIRVRDYTDEGNVTTIANDYGSGRTFTLTKDTPKRIYISIEKGVTVNNLIFKPMLCEGTEAIPYEPYRKRTQALTSETINGEVLTDRTITADKIIAKSITSNELDVNQIFGNEAVLNKIVSQDIFSNAIATSSIIVGLSDDIASKTPLIEGTHTTATQTWTGNAPFSELINGQTIMYGLSNRGSSGNSTLTLTLANRTTTRALPIYYQGNTRVTTQYNVGSLITMTYRENVKIGTSSYTGWWTTVDSNTYDRIKYYVVIKAQSAIVANNIIVGTSRGYKHLKVGTAFDISYPILFAGSAISANATGNNNYIAVPVKISTTQSLTMTAYKPVYIKGKLSGTTFTPVSTTPLTQAVPTTNDGYQYILLGTAYSTTALYLLSEHPIYQYIEGKFQQISSGANANAESIKSNIYYSGTTQIDGNKIYTGSVTADKIDVNDLFAQDITATGSITGATLVSIKDEYAKIVIDKGEITIYDFDTRGEGGFYKIGSLYNAGNAVGASGNWIFDNIETTSGANLDTINSNLSSGIKVDCKYLSYSDEALNQQGALVTTTKTSYSTQIDPITNAHRKFSDYQYLCFELLINSNYVRATMTIPRDRFTEQGFVVELFYVDSINTQRWVDIMYKSDTSFYMIGSSNIVANTRVSITGLIAKY